ncbi:MAG: ribosome maturation factor RimM [Bacteroidales bacterium]|nr:ribosome maturation factor RimM [Bacteroidales bacterium]
MITLQGTAAIGHIIKPHGIHGEMSAVIEADVDLDSLSCLIMDVDGILTPFFISSIRPRGSQGALIKIDGVADETQARAFAGKEIRIDRDDEAWLEPDDEDGDGLYADDLRGFTIVTPSGDRVGEITALDTSTANYLFHVLTPDGRTIYIPVADEFITSMDPDHRVIEMDLPDGILDLW